MTAAHGHRAMEEPDPATQDGRWDVWRDRTVRLARTHWPLGVALAVALTVRVAYLFPIYFYGDDAEYATVAGYLANDPRYLGYPDIEDRGPHPFVSQPPLLLYLFAGAARITGSLETGPVLVSVLLGTATVGLVYAIGHRLDGRATATSAALVLAILPLHVSYSRKALLDAGLAFFATLTILLVLLWARDPSARRALFAGVAATATSLSKLPGVLVLVPMLAAFAAVAWRRVRGRGPEESLWATWRPLLRDAGAAAAPLAVGAVLYLGFVAWLRGLEALSNKLLWNVGRVAGGSDASVPAGGPWHFYLFDADAGLLAQLGIPLAIALVAGVVLLVRRGVRRTAFRPPAWAVLAWPAAFLVFLSLSARKQNFYAMPLMPAWAVLAGVALGAAFLALRSWLATTRISERGAVAVGTVALLILAPLALPPAAATAEDVFVERRSYGYGLEPAAAWIHDEDPDAAQIGTVLGRFTLHFYNGQPAYHYWEDHEAVNASIEAGQTRFLVTEPYLDYPPEREWMDGLLDTYDATVVASFGPDHDPDAVKVYEFRP